MSTDIDWREELDSSFGAGPERPASDYLVPGRAALRRRRTAMGATALVTLVAIGGIGWAIAPSDDDARGSTIASDAPSPTATPTASEQATGSAALPWRKGEGPARVNPGTGLEIREGAVVHQRRDGLHPGKDTMSVALDLSFEGERWWMELEWDEGGSSGTTGRPGEMYDSFDAFVAGSTSGGGMFSPEPDPVADKYPYGRVVDYGLDGIVLRPGATIVRRVANPHEVEPPETSVGLVVEFEGDTIWLSLTASRNGGGGTYENAADSGWTDFDQWLAADVALQKGDSQVSPVAIDDEGVLTPAEPGVKILDQRADPDLPAYTDPSTTASAVAMISREGETWFVLVVRFPGEDAVTTFAASKADGASSLDEFIEFARARADDGSGLR